MLIIEFPDIDAIRGLFASPEQISGRLQPVPGSSHCVEFKTFGKDADSILWGG